MAKSAAERMRAYRIRQNPYGRKAGRPKKPKPVPHKRRFTLLENALHSVWCDLQQEGVKDISFRSLRRRVNESQRRKPIEAFEVNWALQTPLGTDHFYCEGESEAGLPLKITVTDPA